MDSYVLIGPNFKDWLKTLTIVLNLDKSAYVLEAPLPITVDPNAPKEDQKAYAEWVDVDLRVRSYMLASMNFELQTQFENMQSAIERTLLEFLNDIQEFYNNEKKGKTLVELLATFATRGKKRQAQKP
ncbi:uncharacterized protein LOC123224007 [Mangifera indica]|uniref:uncharacterized protein LOC123224007 n=1 Tax=Mangifera indica TaxID=29780 RepID=UPI001CFA9762|nr:uncharacterized protein LOC123224007 [Mangifera indica]